MNDEFNSLFVSAEELNTKILKEILEGRVKLSSDMTVIYEREFDHDQKIMLYTLANKIFLIRGMKKEEHEGPTEISRGTGIPSGTVKNRVLELEGKGFLIKNKQGKYSARNASLSRVKEAMFGGE